MRHFCLGEDEDLRIENERISSEEARRGSASPETSVGPRRTRRAAILREGV